MSCLNCAENFAAKNFLYCPTCGELNPNRETDESVACDYHPDNRVFGFCVVCGRTVCEKCAVKAGEKILCNDPLHLEYLKNWKVIHTFNFDYEAAMLYANLEQRGVETRVFSKLNPDTIDEGSSTIVEVLVQRENFETATYVIKLLNLDEEESEA